MGNVAFGMETTEMKIIVVTKQTAYTRLTEDPSTQNLLGKKDLDLLKAAHQRHQNCVDKVVAELKQLGIRPYIISSGQPFDDKTADFIVTVGGDGTLLSASHYVGNTPLMGINSDPETSVGYLCCAKERLKTTIETPSPTPITRMEVLINGKSVAKRVLNEALFTHSCPAAMTKFVLNNKTFACSGIWVGTGAGSTGAIKSAGGKKMPMNTWLLQGVVRESYYYSDIKTKFVESNFKLVSKIAEAVIYLDGPFLQIPVGYGDAVRFRVSKESLNLVTKSITYRTSL